MRSYRASATPSRPSPQSSFTLVELLTVMAIIAILATLILYAGNGVIQKGLRSRASAEITAISAALEGYKTDNGIYPVYGVTGFQTNTPYSSVDPSGPSGGNFYIQSSETLYQALSGQTNYLDTPTGNKYYMTLKPNQLGNTTATAGTSGLGSTTYVQDPFHYSYGYNTGNGAGTGTTNSPYNGYNFFDLWSSGGKIGTTAANTNSWISNWQ